MLNDSPFWSWSKLRIAPEMTREIPKGLALSLGVTEGQQSDHK